MKDWIENLPTREKRHILKLFEEKGISNFCVDAWIENNPTKTVKLTTCFRTFENIQICPYQPNNEPCRF